MSYANIIMYGAVLPSYSNKNEKKEGTDNVIKADDPRNRDAVRSFIEKIE